MARFRFGPMGRLMVIDSPRGGYTAPVEEIGVVHQSLNGTRVKDVFGHKAAIKIDLDGLDARALSWFEMAYRGALGNQLYYVDEQRVNRLSAVVSSTRSAFADYDPFTQANGTRTTVPNTALLLPATLDGSAVSTPGPISAQQWVTTGTLNLCRPFTERIPVQPGEHLCLSVYQLSGDITLEFTPFAADGTQLGQQGVGASIAGSPVRKYATYVVPSSGVASVVVGIRHAVAQTSVWTGLQLEQGDIPTPWVLGAGSPRVLVDEFPTRRRFVGNHMDGTITLLEV